jgi:CubicO group peptidase (beta-lactamase class C family)
MRKILYAILILLLAVFGYAVYFLDAAMPIGNGYAAKYVCSQVFLANRNPEIVFENDVKPTNPLFAMMSVSVNYDNKTVTSKGFGFWRPLTAVYRDGFGCTLAIDSTREELLQQAEGALPRRKANEALLWPDGEKVDLKAIPKEVNREKLDQVLDDAFKEPGPDTMRNTQAIVIVYRDRIIAERYADTFSDKTPLLGWSMTKSVTNALVGILVKQKKLDIMKPAPLPAWKSPGDPRGAITLDQMLRMSSGLDFVEIYGPLKDVTDMLYGSKSMADFAAAKPLRTKPDTEWYYSSGTANIIARIIRDTVGGTLASVYNFARKQLFDRIGMYSAVIEPDASGSFVGSSYMFATARDWARFGVLIKNDGVWKGVRILPEGWVKYSTTPTPLAPKGEYGAHFWLNRGNKNNPADRVFPSLPRDLVYLSGFNQQIVAIIPSRDLVVVRLGVTHDDSWDDDAFIKEVIDSIGKK